MRAWATISLLLAGCGPVIAPAPPVRAPGAPVVVTLQYEDGGTPADLAIAPETFAACRGGRAGWVLVTFRVEPDGSVHDPAPGARADLEDVTVACVIGKLGASNLGPPAAGGARLTAYVGLR